MAEDDGRPQPEPSLLGAVSHENAPLLAGTQSAPSIVSSGQPHTTYGMEHMTTNDA